MKTKNPYIFEIIGVLILGIMLCGILSSKDSNHFHEGVWGMCILACIAIILYFSRKNHVVTILCVIILGLCIMELHKHPKKTSMQVENFTQSQETTSIGKKARKVPFQKVRATPPVELDQVKGVDLQNNIYAMDFACAAPDLMGSGSLAEIEPDMETCDGIAQYDDNFSHYTSLEDAYARFYEEEEGGEVPEED